MYIVPYSVSSLTGYFSNILFLSMIHLFFYAFYSISLENLGFFEHVYINLF